MNLHKAIECRIQMAKPNSHVVLHNGNFSLKNSISNTIYNVNGGIYFKWNPKLSVHFDGILKPHALDSYILNSFTALLFVNGYYIGKANITSFTRTSKGFTIKGFISKIEVYGKKYLPVDHIQFSIPNFRQYIGSHSIKTIEHREIHSNSIMQLSGNDYTILLDTTHDFKHRSELLKSTGGYLTTHSGVINSKNKKTSYTGTKELFNCLSSFLTFLNGRNTSPLFRSGIINNKPVWTDYESYRVDPYQSVRTWLPKHSTIEFNTIWQKFHALWNNDNDRDFINTAIHWYVSANTNKGLMEGSIVMAQTALELIYNWWIIESKNLITKKEAQRLTASNKIKHILSNLNVDTSIPEDLVNLTDYVKNAIDSPDGPDIVVQIRNSIVHSQEKKRAKLRSITPLCKYEALTLSIYYIELALLRILGHEGQFCDRTSQTFKDEFVPWVDSKS